MHDCGKVKWKSNQVVKTEDSLIYIYKEESLFVCSLCIFTPYEQLQPNFPEIFLSSWRRSTSTFVSRKVDSSSGKSLPMLLTNQIAVFGTVEVPLNITSWIQKICNQRFWRAMSSNLKSMCLKIWLVVRKPIGKWFPGKRSKKLMLSSKWWAKNFQTW